MPFTPRQALARSQPSDRHTLPAAADARAVVVVGKPCSGCGSPAEGGAQQHSRHSTAPLPPCTHAGNDRALNNFIQALRLLNPLAVSVAISIPLGARIPALLLALYAAQKYTISRLRGGPSFERLCEQQRRGNVPRRKGRGRRCRNVWAHAANAW